MSKSSNALFSSFFAGSMRNAAPILFWSALILFVLTVASYSALSIVPSPTDQSDPTVRAHIIFNGLVQGLNNAVWPFTGAAIVWVLQKRAEGGAE